MADDPANLNPIEPPPASEEACAPTPHPPNQFECPHCQQLVDVAPAREEQVLACPHCGGEMTVSSSDPPEPDQDTSAAEEAELDALRIRRISVERRAAIRARTYLWVGAFLCIAGCGQCVETVWRRVKITGWGARPVLFCAIGALCFAGIIYFLQKSIRLTHELAEPIQADPTTPPDFSTLSDGSQFARDLERIE